MKKIIILIAILFPCILFAATKSFSFSCQTAVVRYGQMCYEYRNHVYNFNIEIISDDYGYKSEQYFGKHPFILAYPGEAYSVRIHNPMPVRVAVNLMIDGLNSINGQPCDNPSQGRMWLIEPYSYVTISGWQVDSYSLRRFYFTNISDTYVNWQSYQLDRDLTIRCGQISAAFFWNKKDMEDYFMRHPIYEGNIYRKHGLMYDKHAPSPSARSEAFGLENEAGTGMGQRQSHPVHNVQFYYDTGMYQVRDTVKILYDFKYPSYQRNRRHARPYNQNPYEDSFAPEKP